MLLIAIFRPSRSLIYSFVALASALSLARAAEPETPSAARGTLRGVLMPIATRQLSARTAGVIEKFGAEEGQQVAAGTVLVQLNSDVEQAEIARAQAVLDTATSETDRAKRELDRTTALSGQSIGSKKDLEEAQAAYVIADGRRKQAVADLEMARARFNERQVLAPIAGMVFRRSRAVGEAVERLETVVRLIDASKLELVVYAGADLLGKFKDGQTARISIENGPARGTVISGMVSYVDPVMDPDSATFRVKILIEPTRDVQPGISVTLQLPSEVN